MTNEKKHNIARRAIVAYLKKKGHEVVVQPRGSAFDFLVNGRIRVALRVSYAHRAIQQVTIKDKHHVYYYRTWYFNFHHHGRIKYRYADFIICYRNKTALEDCFVIPWEAIVGKTFSMHEKPSKRYAGRYARWRGAWAEIAAATATT